LCGAAPTAMASEQPQQQHRVQPPPQQEPPEAARLEEDGEEESRARSKERERERRLQPRKAGTALHAACFNGHLETARVSCAAGPLRLGEGRDGGLHFIGRCDAAGRGGDARAVLRRRSHVTVSVTLPCGCAECRSLPSSYLRERHIACTSPPHASVYYACKSVHQSYL